VKFDAEDHKLVGDLPDDFPQKDDWSTFLVEMRLDRNIADYEPWDGTRALLVRTPQESVERAKEFLNESKAFLRTRGLGKLNGIHNTVRRG
jgi:hypothetical protein